jgi:glutamate-1-semialdehyde aminotransferase
VSNMNNIENERMLAFAKDYAELCRKHGLYLVFNDDVWLQEVGDEQDLADVEPDLVDTFNEGYIGGVSLPELRKLQEEKMSEYQKP